LAGGEKLEKTAETSIQKWEGREGKERRKGREREGRWGYLDKG
jgi:hypothetical protein